MGTSVEDSADCVAWLRLDLDKERLDSELLSLPLRPAPYLVQTESAAAAEFESFSSLSVEMNLTRRDCSGGKAVV